MAPRYQGQFPPTTAAHHSILTPAAPTGFQPVLPSCRHAKPSSKVESQGLLFAERRDDAARSLWQPLGQIAKFTRANATRPVCFAPVVHGFCKHAMNPAKLPEPNRRFLQTLLYQLHH